MTITDIPPKARTGRDPAVVHAGLIAMASFIAAHPQLPLGGADPLSRQATGGTDEENRAEVERIAAILGVTAGPAFGSPDYWQARREFGGGIAYQATAVASAEARRQRKAAQMRDAAVAA